MKPLLSLLALLATHAVAGSGEDLVASLSKCDAELFKHLAGNRSQFATLAPMGSQGAHDYFKVPEQRHPTESRVKFRTPLRVNGLDVVGFFDEITNIPDDGIIYSWGVLVEASVAKTAAAFKPLTWESSRLREEEGIFIRSEVWTHARKDQGWARVRTESGLPKPGTVERVLLIEPYDGETVFIRYGCSIQGAVTTEMLRELRPDLGQ